MSGIIVCRDKASAPYYIKDIDADIYSIEELAYYLYNHLYLADESFFSPQLCAYLRNDLGLEQIAQGLEEKLEKKAGLAELVHYLVDVANYYTEKEMIKLDKDLEVLSAKSDIERLKSRGDILLKCNRYGSSFECYKKVINKSHGASIDSQFYSSIYNNMGVICVNMFKYENAVTYFKTAYRMSKDILLLRHIIIADILAQDEEALQVDIRQFNISDDLVTECRGKLENARKQAKLEVEQAFLDSQDKEGEEEQNLGPLIDDIIHIYKTDI